MTDLRQRIEAVLFPTVLSDMRFPDEQWAHRRALTMAEDVLSVLRPDIDTIARAIAQADHPNQDDEVYDLFVRDVPKYRLFARAAVDAMKGESD